MGESTSKIERDIVAERNELGRNLQLLETKARSLADWRTHFRNHPFALMGVALGGGALLGLLTRGGGSQQGEFEEERLIEPEESAYPEESANKVPSMFASSAQHARRQFGDTWDHIADTLLAVASAKAINFIASKIPGFREEFSARHPDHRGGFSSSHNV
jgi:hypothetical protein